MGKTRLNFLRHMIQKTKIPFDFYLKDSCLLGHSYWVQLTFAYTCRSKQSFERTSSTSEFTASNEEGETLLSLSPGHVTHLQHVVVATLYLKYGMSQSRTAVLQFMPSSHILPSKGIACLRSRFGISAKESKVFFGTVQSCV